MWSIVILAILQGVTEFFPVSSSGHLSLLENFFSFNPSEALGIGLVLHLGTVLSVLVFYRKVLFLFLKNLGKYKKFMLCIIVACFPTGVIGLLLKNTVQAMVFNLPLIAVFFFITAVVLLFSYWGRKRFGQGEGSVEGDFSLKHNSKLLLSSLDHLSIKAAFFIGCVQGISVFPGLSRSGLTIATGRLLGLPPLTAGFFSFALMVPVILGASLLEFSTVSYTSVSMFKMFVGFMVSFLVGLVVLKALQSILVKDKLYYFSYYLLLLILGIYLM
ncbi:MAG: undecaprenyl-diphosphate phosphatase [Bdellovibrionaceae bacterium]|nr:undecaprenyl-diphosphate phosphatase [Pseudobdellovibrionaceae bacterium]